MVYPTRLHRRSECAGCAGSRQSRRDDDHHLRGRPDCDRRPPSSQTGQSSPSPTGSTRRLRRAEPKRRPRLRIVTPATCTPSSPAAATRLPPPPPARRRPAGVDILTRSHLFLLQAVERLIADNPSLASTIEIHLAGVLSPTDREAAARSPVVRTPGYLTHAETVTLMRSADLLFLPMQNLPPGIRSGTVPGKTYEYLASGRPILAAVPEGDARDLLLQAGTATSANPTTPTRSPPRSRTRSSGGARGGPSPRCRGRSSRRSSAAAWRPTTRSCCGRSQAPRPAAPPPDAHCPQPWRPPPSRRLPSSEAPATAGGRAAAPSGWPPSGSRRSASGTCSRGGTSRSARSPTACGRAPRSSIPRPRA